MFLKVRKTLICVKQIIKSFFKALYIYKNYTVSLMYQCPFAMIMGTKVFLKFKNCLGTKVSFYCFWCSLSYLYSISGCFIRYMNCTLSYETWINQSYIKYIKSKFITIFHIVIHMSCKFPRRGNMPLSRFEPWIPWLKPRMIYQLNHRRIMWTKFTQLTYMITVSHLISQTAQQKKPQVIGFNLTPDV